MERPEARYSPQKLIIWISIENLATKDLEKGKKMKHTYTYIQTHLLLSSKKTHLLQFISEASCIRNLGKSKI